MHDIDFYDGTPYDSDKDEAYSPHSEQEYDVDINYLDAWYGEWDGPGHQDDGDFLHYDPDDGDWDNQVYEDNSEEYDWYDEEGDGHYYSEEMDDGW